MIDVSLFNQFYTFEDTINDDGQSTFDVANEVKLAYYKFIKEFCPMVSTHWKKYLHGKCLLRETATYLNQLTRSDEAFSYWLILCLHPRVVADHKFITDHGLRKWTEDRKKGKAGKHDSNVKFDEYIQIFQKVDLLRNNEKAYKFWMNLFFDQLFEEYNKSTLNQKEELLNNGNKEATVNLKSIEIQAAFD